MTKMATEPSLADLRGQAEKKLSEVTSRRQEEEALQAAGFPIYDEALNGTKFWRTDAKTLVGNLSRNALTIPELCALYYSRALVKSSSAVAGMLRTSMPACRIAFTTAGAGPSMGSSPSPFAPKGPPGK